MRVSIEMQLVYDIMVLNLNSKPLTVHEVSNRVEALELRSFAAITTNRTAKCRTLLGGRVRDSIARVVAASTREGMRQS